jgi:hypothetical protein
MDGQGRPAGHGRSWYRDALVRLINEERRPDGTPPMTRTEHAGKDVRELREDLAELLRRHRSDPSLFGEDHALNA